MKVLANINNQCLTDPIIKYYLVQWTDYNDNTTFPSATMAITMAIILL